MREYIVKILKGICRDGKVVTLLRSDHPDMIDTMLATITTQEASNENI